MSEFLGEKADVVMLCTSAGPAIEQAWKSVDKGGPIVFFAVPGPEKTVTIPVNDFWTKEIRVLTSYYCGPPDIQESMGLLASKEIDVDSLVTHRLPLEETARGFELVLERRRRRSRSSSSRTGFSKGGSIKWVPKRNPSLGRSVRAKPRFLQIGPI